MPGFELVGDAERAALNEIFDQSGGVLFAHGYDARRAGRYRVREFERAFADELGVAGAVAVTSGTMAQYVAMLAMGVKPGDEVITQSFTFVATVEAILAIGAVPVVVDVDDTYNMDPEQLAAAVSERTKAIVPVHMLGNPARMDEISAVADAHKIPVLEDACEALGAEYKGRPVGSLGVAGVFSLDFGKTITAGEGGMIVSDDLRLLKYCKEYADHGHESNPAVPRGRDTRTIAGLNLRMTEMQAAVGAVQLGRLRGIVEANRKRKRVVSDLIGNHPLVSPRRITDENELADTYIFRLESADMAREFVSAFTAAGYHTKNVPDAMDWHFAGRWEHMFVDVPAYRDSWSTEWSRGAELLARSVSIPIYVKASLDDVRTLCATAIDILDGMR